jgi:hypothetical protein
MSWEARGNKAKGKNRKLWNCDLRSWTSAQGKATTHFLPVMLHGEV